ncbi:MAG TPA: thioesterase family protein [Actinotalea caeni]|uniref:acyl-CoA thioesterase n=1 Tax=Actinotalea caeni TaxID=1348467 RepID=UPI002B4B1E34|nr:thioesterase family protein [Actinotalea caeni]HLV54599.1 thioesterase family protein [Actinotalea caeni]
MSRISIPIQIRWSDIDGYGHVNNAAMLTLLEEARIATFWNADLPEGAARPTQTLVGGPTAEHFTLVARQEVEYLAPLPFSQRPARVDLWVSRIGGASLEVNYEVFSPDDVRCAIAATSIVMVDAASGRPRKLTAEERAALEPLLDEPLQFRRR